jgi:hypothetical protein
MFEHLPAGEQTRIRNFLSSVESDMRRTGASNTEIVSVREALSEQIVDAREEAGPGADLAQILKSIDPPYSFAETGAEEAGDPQDAALLGKLSLGFAVAGVATAVLSQIGGEDFADRVGGPAFVFSELLAVCLGALARRTVLGRAGLVCALACLALLLVIAAIGG